MQPDAKNSSNWKTRQKNERLDQARRSDESESDIGGQLGQIYPKKD